MGGGKGGWAAPAYSKGAAKGGKAAFEYAPPVQPAEPKGKGKQAAPAALPAAVIDPEQPPLQYGEGGNSLEAAPEDPAILESAATTQFAIPRESISRVLGKGGAIASEIRTLAGVTLKIDTNSGPDGLVILGGSVLGIHMAQCMVLARVRSWQS